MQEEITMSSSDIILKGIPKSEHIAKWRRLFPPEMLNPPEIDVSSRKRKWLDLPYTTNPQGPKLDIYLPESTEGPYPVIVYIHGGGWFLGHKRVAYMEPLFYMLEHGYALVSIDYTLSDQAEFPTQIYEIKTAIRFLRQHAEIYNLQAHRIAVLGDSAGGHLAALAGTSGATGALEDLSLGWPQQSSKVQAVVDWFGPTNLAAMQQQLQDLNLPSWDSMACTMEDLFIGADLSQEPEKAKPADPATYLTPEAPPFMIQHGDKDTVVPCQQSISFAQKLEEAIGKDKVIFEILPGAVHEDPRFYAQENLDKVIKFLDQYLK